MGSLMIRTMPEDNSSGSEAGCNLETKLGIAFQT